MGEKFFQINWIHPIVNWSNGRQILPELYWIKLSTIEFLKRQVVMEEEEEEEEVEEKKSPKELEEEKNAEKEAQQKMVRNTTD